jgi:hypothetical protein
MAKQGYSGVVAAVRDLQRVQGKFQNLGGQFLTGYQATIDNKKQLEANNKALQDMANKYMANFDSYVDVAKYSDEEANLIKSKVVEYRNEFAEAASAAARLRDQNSAEAQAYQDVMNGVRSKMERLRNNLQGLSNLRIEYATDIENREYSNSSKNTQNILRANAILEGKVSSVNDDGSLQFDGYSVPVAQADGSFTELKSEAFSYSTNNFKKPFKIAKQEAATIFELAERQSTAKGPMLPHVRKGIELQVGELLSNDDVLYSMLTNSQLQLISLDDIDPDNPNAREMAVQSITQAIVDSRGTGVIQTKQEPSKGRDSDKQDVYSATEQATLSQLSAMANNPNKDFTLKGGYGNARFIWNPRINSFLEVDNNNKVKMKDGMPFNRVTLDEYINTHPTLKEEDIKKSLGVK